MAIVRQEDEERRRKPLEFTGTFYSDRWVAYFDETCQDYYFEDTVSWTTHCCLGC